MNVAIMQPYFFPYIGYFQLMHAVDTFVVYDDVHFMKKGWIHRNRILLEGEPHPIVLPIQKASQNRLICDHERALMDEAVEKQLTLLRQAYQKAPYFDIAFPVVEQVLRYPESNVGRYLMYGLERIARYFGLDTRFLLSSDLEPIEELRGQARIIERCRQLGATHYVNAINGMSLYDPDAFSEYGIRLSFLKTDPITYEQGEGPFHPNLSILDVMMYNDPVKVKELLSEYALVSSRHVIEEV